MAGAPETQLTHDPSTLIIDAGPNCIGTVPAGRFSTTLLLILLTAAVANLLLPYGSALLPAHVSLLAIALLALLYWSTISRTGPVPPLYGPLKLAIILFPLYVAFQLAPLPLSLIKILSPARAHMLEALSRIMPTGNYATLSVDPPATWAHLFRIVGCGVVFLLIHDMASRSGIHIWKLAVPLIVLAVTQALLGITQYAVDPAHGFARGTYLNRNHFAGLLEMCLPFAVVYALYVYRTASSRRQWLSGPVWMISVSLVACALMLGAIIYTFSRIATVACAASLFVIAASSIPVGLRRGRKIAAVIGILLFVLISVVCLLPERSIARYVQTATIPLTNDTRWLVWRDTLHLIAAYPLFGCGFGAYESAFLKYQTTDIDSAYLFAHNDYLQLIAELGGIGFLIPAVLIGAVLVNAAGAMRSVTEPLNRFLGIACTAAVAAILIHSLVDFNLYVLPNALVLTWISGIAAGLYSRKWSATGYNHVTQPRRTLISIRPVAIAFTCILAVYCSLGLFHKVWFRGGAGSTNQLDLSDLGLRAVQTKGSIAAGSNHLNVSTAAGFQEGDRIIVAVGGEPGGGRRGTPGVGGAWPQLSYPNLTAMRAELSQPANTFAYTKDTGKVYQFINGAWTYINDDGSGRITYYTNTVFPIALKAKIKNISGNTLTLDHTAFTSSTGANVYLDISPVLRQAFQTVTDPGYPGYTVSSDTSGATPERLTIQIPAGMFAVGEPLVFPKRGWTLAGQGKDRTTLFSPEGTASFSLTVLAPDVELRDFQVIGNFREHGYGLRVTQTVAAQPFPSAILFSTSDNGKATNIRIIDVPQAAIGVSYSSNVWAANIDVVMTYGVRQYTGWLLQWAASQGGGCIHCSVTSARLIPGLEAFQSTGTLFQNFRSINAIVSMNSAEAFTLDDLNITITADSQLDENSVGPHNPIININTNINNQQGTTAPPLKGGMIKNAVIKQTGYINAQNDTLAGIVVNRNNPNITIVGGSYTAPPYSRPSTLAGAEGIRSSGANTTVDGFRVIGSVNPDRPEYFANIFVSDGTVKNCVVGTIVTGPVVKVINCRVVHA